MIINYFISKMFTSFILISSFTKMASLGEQKLTKRFTLETQPFRLGNPARVARRCKIRNGFKNTPDELEAPFLKRKFYLLLSLFSPLFLRFAQLLIISHTAKFHFQISLTINLPLNAAKYIFVFSCRKIWLKIWLIAISSKRD